MPSRITHLAADQKLIDGVQQHLAQFASLSVGSHVVTPADIVAALQGRIDAGKAVQLADGARSAAVKADRDERAQTAALVSSLRRIVLGMFMHSPDTLGTFGMKAPRVGKPSVETTAAAVAKNKATRKARGTVGPRKKLAIHGVVPEIPAPPKV